MRAGRGTLVVAAEVQIDARLAGLRAGVVWLNRYCLPKKRFRLSFALLLSPDDTQEIQGVHIVRRRLQDRPQFLLGLVGVACRQSRGGLSNRRYDRLRRRLSLREPEQCNENQ